MKKLFVLMLMLTMCALAGATAVSAQDDMAEPAITCDATLITLLLVAIEHHDFQPPLPLDRYAFGPYDEQAVSDEPDAPTVREQAEARVAQAATSIEEGGFPGIAREIAALSDTVGDIAEAGSSLLEAGRAALEAGRAALDGTEQVGPMTLGALPGEPDECTDLRRTLVSFLFTQLTAAEPE